MGFGQAIFANIVSWVITLIIGVVGKYFYDSFIGKGTGLEMSFFQMLLSIIGILAVVNFIVWAIVAVKKRPDIPKTVLKDIAVHRKQKDSSMWSYGKHDPCGGVPLNDTWETWIKQLVKVTERPDLEPHNFGNHFYIFDLSNSEVTEFPTDKATRESLIRNTIPTGKIFRVMQKV